MQQCQRSGRTPQLKWFNILDSPSVFSKSQFNYVVISGKIKFHSVEISRKLSRSLRITFVISRQLQLTIKVDFIWFLESCLMKTNEINSFSRENGGNKVHECMTGLVSCEKLFIWYGILTEKYVNTRENVKMISKFCSNTCRRGKIYYFVQR